MAALAPGRDGHFCPLECRARRRRGDRGRSGRAVGGVRAAPGGRDFVVLDGDAGPGGAWQHRWPSLRLDAAHRIHPLPGLPLPDADPAGPASEVVAGYFADYERRFELPVHRPVAVRAVHATRRRLPAATPARARGRRAGRDQRHRHLDPPVLAGLPGPRALRRPPVARGRLPRCRGVPRPARGRRGRRHVGGAAADRDQRGHHDHLGDPPATGVAADDFGEDAGRAAVALVDQRVRAGLPPGSVVGVTGLVETDAVRAARGPRGAGPAAGVRPAHRRTGSPGTTGGPSPPTSSSGPPVSGRRWTTWRRCTCAPPAGDRDGRHPGRRQPRLHLVGYGPSASTIGANRAGPAPSASCCGRCDCGQALRPDGPGSRPRREPTGAGRSEEHSEIPDTAMATGNDEGEPGHPTPARWPRTSAGC